MRAMAAAVVLLAGCQSLTPDIEIDALSKSKSIRVEREERLGEGGTKSECAGNFAIESDAFQSYLRAARHAVDPLDSPRSRLGALSFTWYFRRLKRGCYLHEKATP